MHIESMASGHWTDDQLIQYIYGLQPDGISQPDHLSHCEECHNRLQDMRLRKQSLEAESSWDGIDAVRLAEQRRAIYARIETPVRWWNSRPVWRWVSAGTAIAAVAGGLMVYQTHPRHLFDSQEANISDAQLAQEVSCVAQSSEAQATAPLEGLFE